MKKQLSALMVVLLLILGSIALYVNFAYFPLDRAMKKIQDETFQYRSQKMVYSVYSEDSTTLDKKLTSQQKSVDDAKAVIDAASPGRIANDLAALKTATGANIVSIGIGSPTALNTRSSDGTKMLYSIPVTLSLGGSIQSSLQLISDIQKLPSAAYSVDRLSYSGANQNFTVALSLKYFAAEQAQPQTGAADGTTTQ
jgi:hypothetical protein